MNGILHGILHHAVGSHIIPISLYQHGAYPLAVVLSAFSGAHDIVLALHIKCHLRPIALTVLNAHNEPSVYFRKADIDSASVPKAGKQKHLPVLGYAPAAPRTLRHNALPARIDPYRIGIRIFLCSCRNGHDGNP